MNFDFKVVSESKVFLSFLTSDITKYNEWEINPEHVNVSPGLN